MRLNTHNQRTTDPRYQSLITEFKLDAQGTVYFTTMQGIFRYTVQGVLQQIGFGSYAHYIDCIYVSPSNRLWVSSNVKLYEYDLNQARVFSSLLFINLTINGTPLSDNASATQNMVYDAQGHPTLTVRENDPLTMQFTLSAKQERGTLRWRLNEYDHDWISSQNITGEAAYQLPAGTYTFTVNRGSDTGKWEPTVSTLTIVVVAPFWKTPAFLAFVLVVVLGLGYYFFRTYTRRRQLARQLAREQEEAANLRQLDELKTRFFSNVTHEFRTPLTIILNATEQLTAKASVSGEQPEVALIEPHAHQLLRLITETLDLARLESGKLEAHPQLGHPVWFMGQVVAQFAGLATQRGIDLTFNTHSLPASDDPLTGTSPEEGLFSFDGEKWEKIAYNLLANALKFTPNGGRVQVTGHVTAANQFMLTVSDTGIGIPQDQLERIFERFHQVDARSTRSFSGTGIGLSLVRELAHWLGGHVRVESRIDQGSTFTVELPLTVPNGDPSSPPTAAVDAPPLHAAPILPTNQPTLVPKRERPTLAVFTEVSTKPLVLVVEDNDDLRAQVVDYLSATYQVLSAANGRLGWEQALAQVPDLIVSDVMMPELDGYELLERVKNDERTSHIPLILLTARSAFESRMQGLQGGADDYLVKPFSLVELVLRIGNGLRTRQNWQKRFLAQPTSAQDPLSVDRVMDREEAFLDRLRQGILGQLEEEVLDVDWLARQAGMSRAQLNRKLFALTGLSPNRFIQRVRLERAAELLQTGSLTMAEVAERIGYDSPSHFAKVFQAQFGYPPHQLKRAL
ncbi:ATP-binding protein [Spirosoma utsteinense]|uniref:ATP-binding protein n=1 Tax=Spirosoma utsteinense TaxID=2585773 RepID=UPI001647B12C|nr:ATP-binding protein [Spirosoma utsteinense]MBC3787754.1 signal transduction histidine kinase/DNA-binding response OmpR family regulator [Spirosoma utsteinense]